MTSSVSDPGWQPPRPPLDTPWTGQVGPDNALPEYPRPRLVRRRWLNLNGVWEYTTPGRYGERILVPYPPESALSGIGRHDDRMWYRRTFELPDGWEGDRVLLHFGAVDQVARVWVNNQLVATHEGGYTAFTADISGALRTEGEQELVVRAEDTGDRGTFPVGKQANDPGGILYTQASGIWQTVWLEPVGPAYVERLDVAGERTGFAVTPRVSGAQGHRAEVVVTEPGGAEVARATGPAGDRLWLPVPEPRSWSPADPYLYDLTVRLLAADGRAADEASSYAGLRTIELVPDGQGRPRIALNGRITFLHGPLDQGYWPDGIYTAPTDEALRFDLEQTRQAGFNCVRKHVKVEPERWYYWADRLGLLVWQDMPNLPVLLDNPPGPQAPPVRQARLRFEAELAALIGQLRGVTSIIGWVPFNEGWGEYDTARIAAEVKAADPDRLVVADSGVNCCHSHPDSGAGDVYDDHTYVGPGRPEIRDRRALAAGEYGGLGLVLDGHSWPGQPQAYEMATDAERLTGRYAEMSRDLAAVVRDNGLSLAIYTQTTDVENEVNGLLSYDRRVVKPDLTVVAEHNRAVIDIGSD
ncbi:glycoside hydrolase family 2 protein [Amycolatopsis aidingensis]|uniref:glycoside hydrolase family 2 protein n=1 Tax=Amycolatopsis aidingensis TaxID=2842453 RepID=UPI001C0BC5F6|nr:sugar-binding domain-containing protein [Amycolatopsis aidingensis]